MAEVYFDFVMIAILTVSCNSFVNFIYEISHITKQYEVVVVHSIT